MSFEHSDDFYFNYKDNLLYVGSTADQSNNGAYNKAIVNANLPAYFKEIKIYGTFNDCLSHLDSLKTVFIPKTYKVIGEDFCLLSKNVESITFEDDSQVESIGGWFAYNTAIHQIKIPSSIKTLAKYTFSGCKNLLLVVYMGNLIIKDTTTFNTNVPSNLVILVNKNYPYSTFGGRKVTKVLYKSFMIKSRVPLLFLIIFNISS